MPSKENQIFINEIAWMGDANNWRNEWIEIKNNTLEKVVLDNWVLMIDDNKTNLFGEISPKGFFLISKNKNITHDSLFKGSLNNNGNRLTLLNYSNRIVDELDFSSGWPAGDNETKRTMEKSLDEGWHTSIHSGGTPGKENSKAQWEPKNISSLEIIENQTEHNGFNTSLLTGIFFAFFITIFSLYLNVKIKKIKLKICQDTAIGQG